MRPALLAEKRRASVSKDCPDKPGVIRVWFRFDDDERRPVVVSGDKPVYKQLAKRMADGALAGEETPRED
jgi:hypothetical protein